MLVSFSAAVNSIKSRTCLIYTYGHTQLGMHISKTKAPQIATNFVEFVKIRGVFVSLTISDFKS